MMWLVGALTMASCGDDSDYVYPNVVTQMVDILTDADGVATSILTDAGHEYAIQAREGLDGLTADSTYRMVVQYVELEGDEIKLYTAQKAISPNPKPIEEFKQVKTDPVSLTSIWRGGEYLNLVVKAQVKTESHNYHFMETGIDTRQTDGHRIVNLTLYHDRNDDVEAFSRTVYLSVPLRKYADALLPGDSIRFSLNTYEDGFIERKFAW
jgi:hypothetical protein